MKLVKPTDALKKSKRVGRGNGSGLGTTAGRGHKGAGQRSGHKYRFWFEGGQMPLHRRVPMRGFNCLLYTSDAADDSLRVDLGGRRIIKKI